MTACSSDKRLLILHAVEKLIAEEGFEGLSMHKLAKEAGVATGTIYRYFEDKHHLLYETRLHALARAAEIIQAGVNDEMPLKVRYRCLWLNIWHHARTENALKSHLLYEQLISLHLDHQQLAQLRQRENQLFCTIHNLFEEGKQQGLFKPLDNKILFGVSLESSSSLARKQRTNCIELNDEALEMAIEASWDALIQH